MKKEINTGARVTTSSASTNRMNVISKKIHNFSTAQFDLRRRDDILLEHSNLYLVTMKIVDFLDIVNVWHLAAVFDPTCFTNTDLWAPFASLEIKMVSSSV